jgi:uncharacterized protein with PQ loop repeat
MNVHSLALPIAYLGSVLGVAMVLPQLIRTMRRPELPGVSALSYGLATASCLAWLIYGIRTTSVPQIPGNVLLILGTVSVVMLVPSAVSRGRRGLALGAAAMTILALSSLVPAQTVGYAAFAISLTSAWPQLIESFGTWRTGGESGLSLTTFSVKLASGVCWLTYAALAFDGPVLVASVVGLSTSLAIMGMEFSARLSVARGSVPAFDLA